MVAQNPYAPLCFNLDISGPRNYIVCVHAPKTYTIWCRLAGPSWVNFAFGLTIDVLIYMPASSVSDMQIKNSHTLRPASNQARSILYSMLLVFFLVGCQTLAHKPQTSAEQAATQDVGLLRNDVQPPAALPDAEGPTSETVLPEPAETVPDTTQSPPETPPQQSATTTQAQGQSTDAKTAKQELGMALNHHRQSVADPKVSLADEALSGIQAVETPEPVTLPPPLPPKTPQMILDEALGFCEAAQEFWQKGELENALEALDQAYSLILEIEFEDQPQQMQQKEDLRFLISKRILEIYASRNTVANGSHNAIPMELNRHVEAEIRLFTRGSEKKFFKQSLIRSGRYRPFIISRLKAIGMPEELSWLPLIESGFKVKALSKARALGLWQFIPSTGYKFGLKRNRYIDERIDPIKSTKAAIAYLQELHGIFGDWITALAAYNCGEGRVLRVIRSQNVNYLDNFWDLYERLPRETARYVPRFLATLHIIKNASQYGLDSVVRDEPLDYQVVEVSKQVQLTDIAGKIGVRDQVLKDLNPELRYNILPPETYPLRVPPASTDRLLASIDDIPISHPPRSANATHRVRPGETLSGIAKKYRTSVRRIMRANNLRSSNFIVAGKKLRIPLRGTVIARANTAQKKSTGKTVIHRVRSGDSLWIIARRYGTTTKRIQSLNGLKSTTLHIGQRLKVPEYRYEQPTPTSTNQYSVRRGDSPYKIARRYNMSLGRLLRINNLTPRSKIFPGQVLKVQ